MPKYEAALCFESKNPMDDGLTFYVKFVASRRREAEKLIRRYMPDALIMDLRCYNNTSAAEVAANPPEFPELSPLNTFRKANDRAEEAVDRVIADAERMRQEELSAPVRVEHREEIKQPLQEVNTDRRDDPKKHIWTPSCDQLFELCWLCGKKKEEHPTSTENEHVAEPIRAILNNFAGYADEFKKS